MDISILIITTNEANDVPLILSQLNEILTGLVGEAGYEFLVVCGANLKKKTGLLNNLKARIIELKNNRYGDALRKGLESAKGEFIITLDADLSYDIAIVQSLWANRHQGEVIIASRFMKNDLSREDENKFFFQILLSAFFRNALSIPITDIGSGLRLYHSKVLKNIHLEGKNFDILLETILKVMIEGWQVKDIPINYIPRPRLIPLSYFFKFGFAYLSMLYKLWRIRNSIDAADYDRRAFHSRIVFQRFWQRSRHAIITKWVPDGAFTLDIGCGSSQILIDLDHIVGMDIRQNKLRFMRQFDKDLLNGTIYSLPFPAQTFDCIICAEVIEHIPYDEILFKEFHRVLKKGGILILGTPDYGTWQWPLIEAIYKFVIPGGYADEHITHYTHQSLKDILNQHGFRHLETKSVLDADIMLRCEKE